MGSHLRLPVQLRPRTLPAAASAGCARLPQPAVGEGQGERTPTAVRRGWRRFGDHPPRHTDLVVVRQCHPDLAEMSEFALS
jgi:hypothetical protein